MGKSQVSNRSFESIESSLKMRSSQKESLLFNSQNSRKSPEKHISSLIIAIVVGIVIAAFFIITSPKIKEIEAKKQILVHPGEKEDLGLVVRPNKVNWKGLEFEIDNEDIVSITTDWCVVGLDGLGDKDSDKTTIVIWGGEAEPAIVNITVERQENSDNNHILEEIPELD